MNETVITPRCRITTYESGDSIIFALTPDGFIDKTIGIPPEAASKILGHFADVAKTAPGLLPNICLTRSQEGDESEGVPDLTEAVLNWNDSSDLTWDAFTFFSGNVPDQALVEELNKFARRQLAGFYSSPDVPDTDTYPVVQLTDTGNYALIGWDGSRTYLTAVEGVTDEDMDHAISEGDCVEIKSFKLASGGMLFLWPNGHFITLDTSSWS